jgi:hypothetical protein
MDLLVTDAVVVAILGVVAALIGYVATYVNNIRMGQRQAKLDRVNRQLSEFYGPLLAISSASGEAWESSKATAGRRVASLRPMRILQSGSGGLPLYSCRATVGCGK